jgi:hypothetical protein
MPMNAAMIVAVVWVCGSSVVRSVIAKSRCESDQARVIEIRRSGCDRLETSLMSSLMRDGISMFVASAKMEKIRLASEPKRTASSMMRASPADELSRARSGAASIAVSVVARKG